MFNNLVIITMKEMQIAKTQTYLIDTAKGLLCSLFYIALCLETNNCPLTDLMPPLHQDTSELGVVPCGKEIWTLPHGTTQEEKRHTGTLEFPSIYTKLRCRVRYEYKVNTVINISQS